MLTEGLFPTGFSYEKDTRLYFDDTCVVPERLEGKSLAPEEPAGELGLMEEDVGALGSAVPGL